MNFRRGTKQYVIAQHYIAGRNEDETFQLLKPMVESQTQPMIFSSNVSGRRVPKSMPGQIIALRHNISRVFDILDNMKSEEFDEIKDEIDIPDEVNEIPQDEPDEDEPEPDKLIAKGKKAIEDEKRRFLAEVKRIRQFCKERAIAGQLLDEISMRPVHYGRRAIESGIPGNAMLYAMTMHWPDDSLTAAGIEKFNFNAISKSEGSGFHKLAGYVKQLAECRIPTMLIGPAGSGKSHLAQQIAQLIFGDTDHYGECPLTAGATPSWLIGSHTVQGFTTRPFLEIYSKGGVFNFEEMDSADPNMLLVVNNALAADRFYNPVNGETYIKHEDFIPVCTANTFGLGANRQYSGRERLDAATIDRWRMGRVLVEIDENLETHLMFS